MKINLACVFFGALFGFTLGWARLSDPDVIHAMLRFQELDVFLIMGLAIATGAVGARILRANKFRAWLEGSPITWRSFTPTRHHVIGAVLFGVGWSFTNACPGPIAVQLGSGKGTALFLAAGLLLGIALHDARRKPESR